MKRIPQVLCSFLIFITAFSLLSCSKKGPYLDISENISYYEADQYANIYEIRSHADDFISLKKEDMNNLSKLVSSEDQFLWLKIDFDLPGNMKYQSLGLFIGQLRSAHEIWLNSRYIGSAGELSGNKFSNGFISHYYLLPERLFVQGTNSIYIKLWTGPFGFISDSIYLTNPKNAHMKASIYSYFNSEIYISFGIMLLVATFFYFLLFITKKVKNHNNEYFMFSLMTLSSLVFLVPFFASELPWVINSKISYLFFIKIHLCIGAYTTVYFASCFVRKCLNIKLSKTNFIITIFILVAQIILTIIPSYFAKMFSFAPFVIAGIFVQLYIMLTCIIKGFKNNETKKSSINILVGFCPVDLAFIADLIVRNIFQNKTIPYFTIYGWGFTVIAFIVLLIIKFNTLEYKNYELTNNLKDFNSNLEQLIKKRTEDLTLTNQFLAEQMAQTNEDMRTAKYVQQGLLPEANISFDGWDISVAFIPLNNVSGNFYDYYSKENVLNGIGLFDVNEHGTSAGLLSMMAKSIIAQTFNSDTNTDKPVSEILFEINKNIRTNENKLTKYFTGCLIKTGKIKIEDNSCEVEISTANSPDCILYDSNKETTSSIEIDSNSTSNTVLGSDTTDIIFNQTEIRMKVNDTLVLFTTGLLNSKNIQNVNFDKTIIYDILKRYKFDSAQRIQSAIISALDNFIGNSQLKDDITVMVLKRI